MSILVTVISVYLLVGILALAVLDILTKRIRHRLRDASYDTQATLLDGVQMQPGAKMALAITIIALWLLWLPVIMGALYDWFRGLIGGNNGKKE